MYMKRTVLLLIVQGQQRSGQSIVLLPDCEMWPVNLSANLESATCKMNNNYLFLDDQYPLYTMKLEVVQ